MFASAQLSHVQRHVPFLLWAEDALRSQRRALSVEWYVCREAPQGIDGDDMHVYHAPTECGD